MGGGALEDWMKSNALIDYTWAHISASCKNIYNLLPPPFQKIKWRRKCEPFGDGKSLFGATPEGLGIERKPSSCLFIHLIILKVSLFLP